jgi:hypothetical protein
MTSIKYSSSHFECIPPFFLHLVYKDYVFVLNIIKGSISLNISSDWLNKSILSTLIYSFPLSPYFLNNLKFSFSLNILFTNWSLLIWALDKATLILSALS